ncbi:hypothetical protein QAD02_009330 [Eretmocerus hayati]|uniref:Uncharacterized protein n=1 Tax=Eretmocerus hayati TaxID=131215 RepID=A0ACC2N934_9HYME|nr:hypothetical protein QAD02_009330 [Eretmocerus hayati]
MLSDMNQANNNNKMAELVEEYRTTLQDLRDSSKPFITMLTQLADEYSDYAPAIVGAIEAHLQQVRNEVKLPVLYLIDSIIKNLKEKNYRELFEKNMVTTFCGVFKKVNETIRAKMWKLRDTWNDIFSPNMLHRLDVQVNSIDPGWPISKAPVELTAPKSFIHVNPKFLQQHSMQLPVRTEMDAPSVAEFKIREELLKKQKELLELQKQKIQWEMMKQRQKVTERPPVHINSELLAPDPRAKVPIMSTVPSEIAAPKKETLAPVESPQSLRSSSRKSSTPRLLPNDPRVRTAAALNNGAIATKNDAPCNFVATEELTKAKSSPKRISHMSKLSGEASSSKSAASPSRSRSGDVTGVNEKSAGVDVAKKSSNNKCVDDDNSQRSSSSVDEEEQLGGSLIVSPPQPVANLRRSKRHRNSESRTPNEEELQQPPKHSKQIEPSKKPQEDEDLRSVPVAPPLPPTTPQPSVVAASSSGAGAATDSKEDLDLRVLPPLPSNKRQSADSPQGPNAKKSKEDRFDELFGTEDVDLRLLTPVKPLQSSSPGISSSREDLMDEDIRPKDQNIRPKDKDIRPKDKDVRPKDKDIRSKDKDKDVRIKDKDSRSKDKEARSKDKDKDTRSKDKETGWGKEKESSRVKDSWANHKSESDYRGRIPRSKPHNTPPPSGNSEPDQPPRRRLPPALSHPPLREKYDQRNSDRNIEIIMKQAAENLNQGTITKMQYNKLIQEVLHMSEDQMLRAAQRKERESGHWDRITDKHLRPKEHGMHRPPGPRWQQPWHQPWSHPPGPFQGPYRPDFRPVGPWQKHPRVPFGGPMRPDFRPPFHGGFNPRMGHPPPPIGPNGPVLLPNGPLNPPIPGGPMNSLIPSGPPPPLGVPPNVIMGGSGPLISHQRPPGVGSGDDSPNRSYNNDSEEPESEEMEPVTDQVSEADPELLEEISKDMMKTITIDGLPKEVRYYGDQAVIFMHWDDPRDVYFQSGARRVFIDGKEALVCSFNDDYREFTHNGEVHRIKLGAPTRELFIDDKWYQCFFGGQPINIELGNKKVSVNLEGPPPGVRFGNDKRSDLVIGKINLIINARTMVPVFLDAKPQMFEVHGLPCTLEFMDALQTVLLNGQPYSVEFGGLPMSVVLNGEKHFIRFSKLPRGFRAGYVKIANMKGEQPKELPQAQESTRLSTLQTSETTNAISVSSPIEHDSTSQDGLDNAFESKSDIQLDVLSSVVTSGLAPSSGMSYQAEPSENQTTSGPTVTLPLNLNELFQRLVETGIVSNLFEIKKTEEEEKKAPEIIPVSFDKPETLKTKQPAMVSALYSGIQCSSCGARFAPEMATRYSRHLDWHFRQNRKERDSSRKAHSRLWYYEISDWIQFEEIEDLEDRAQSWFETEKQSMEIENAAAEELFDESLQPSVPTGSDEDAQCHVCREAFVQFYHDEKEEWHLRPAVNFDGKNFHPLCLEDHKRSLEESTLPADISEDDNKTKTDDGETKMEVSGNDNETDEQQSSELKSEIKDESENGLNEEGEAEIKTEAMDTTDLLDALEGESKDVAVPIDNKIDEATSDEPNDQSLETVVEGVTDTQDHRESEDQDSKETNQNDSEPADADVGVKEEPFNSADEPSDSEKDAEDELPESAGIDSTQVEVKSTIDGNVELEATTTTIPAAQSKIKINITKPLPSPKEMKDSKEEKPQEEENQEEEVPLVQEPASIKPSLRDRNLSVLPPIEKGEELSGLCSIM